MYSSSFTSAADPIGRRKPIVIVIPLAWLLFAKNHSLKQALTKYEQRERSCCDWHLTLHVNNLDDEEDATVSADYSKGKIFIDFPGTWKPHSTIHQTRRAIITQGYSVIILI
jgi:hypothetical protein